MPEKRIDSPAAGTPLLTIKVIHKYMSGKFGSYPGSFSIDLVMKVSVAMTFTVLYEAFFQ
ncbi:MAG: hypothetical protein OXS28_13490 [Gammaproteobacteria bacterium]|nr:hypothetical protein [Gammaproteobacteria bacterium]MDE0283338.1 hypothetical protein [Gammaproteobacteria bacterium]